MHDAFSPKLFQRGLPWRKKSNLNVVSMNMICKLLL